MESADKSQIIEIYACFIAPDITRQVIYSSRLGGDSKSRCYFVRSIDTYSGGILRQAADVAA